MTRCPIKYAVNGRLMSVSDVAREMGVTRNAVRLYRERHLNPDGTPLSLQETYDVYDKARRAGRSRVGRSGRKPGRYVLPDGSALTMREIAWEIGISVQALYAYKHTKGHDLAAVYQRLERSRMRRAEQKILAIINEAPPRKGGGKGE